MRIDLANKLVLSTTWPATAESVTRSVAVDDDNAVGGTLIVDVITGTGVRLDSWLEYTNDDQNWTSDPFFQAQNAIGTDAKVLKNIAFRRVRARFRLQVSSGVGSCIVSLVIDTDRQ